MFDYLGRRAEIKVQLQLTDDRPILGPYTQTLFSSQAFPLLR